MWDGIDPYIGLVTARIINEGMFTGCLRRYVLDAHANLTEIDKAFDLYWRAGVDPSQVVSV